MLPSTRLASRLCGRTPRANLLKFTKRTVFLETEETNFDNTVLAWDEVPEERQVLEKRLEALDLFFKKGDVNKSVAILDQLIAQNKTNVGVIQAHSRVVCVIPARSNEALDNIDKALKYVPLGVSASLWATKAFVQFIRKQFDPAIVTAKQALKRNPQLRDANYNLALSQSGLKQYYPSLIYYDNALKQNPDVEIQYWKGQSLFFLDQHKEAVAWLQDPKIEEHPLRGQFYAGLRDYANASYSNALTYFEKAKTGRAWNPLDKSDLLSWRGECHLRLGESEKALNCFDEALVYNKDDALSYHGRGEAFKLQNKGEEAQKSFSKALSIDPFYYKSDYLRVKHLTK